MVCSLHGLKFWCASYNWALAFWLLQQIEQSRRQRSQSVLHFTFCKTKNLSNIFVTLFNQVSRQVSQSLSHTRPIFSALSPLLMSERLKVKSEQVMPIPHKCSFALLLAFPTATFLFACFLFRCLCLSSPQHSLGTKDILEPIFLSLQSMPHPNT